MSKIKHSKYKNTGILFELLVRQITSDTLDGKESPIKELLKKYFVKTELGKEYRLYESLLLKTNLTEGKANMVIDTLLESSKNLNRKSIKKLKYNLISEIQKHYDLNEFFNHKLPNYKTQAAFYTLLESTNSEQPQSHELVIQNKLTILEHLSTISKPTQNGKDEIMDEFKLFDESTRMLTYRILLEKFNNKYELFNPHQKSILKELITSIDNTPRLKEFYITKSQQIKEELSTLNSKTKDLSTKIKIDEIISLIKQPSKTTKITDNDLVNLLQYCDLLNELESTNG